MEKSIRIISDFQLNLYKTDTDLNIEAENQKSCTQFFAQIAADVIPSLTQHLFDDIDGLYTGLLSGLDSSSQETKVTISLDGKLQFSHKTMIGKKEKIFSFTITLQEKVFDPLEKAQRQINKLLASQVEYEEAICRITKLEEIITLQADRENKMLQKFEEISSRMDSLEKMTIERLNNLEEKAFAKIEEMRISTGNKSANSMSNHYLYFDAECFNKDKFILTNGNKTVTLKSNDGARYAVFAQAPLPLSKKQEFSIRIDTASENNGIMIGITSGNNKSSSYCYSSKGSYLFYCYNRACYLNGIVDNSDVSKAKVSQGSILKVVVDFEANNITFFLDGLEQRKANADFTTFKSYGFYPCIELYPCNTSVSFV